RLFAGAAGLRQGRRSQLAPGRSLAEQRPPPRAVARAQHVAQVGLVVEGVRVLRRVAPDTHVRRRLAPDRKRLARLLRGLRVDAARPVAHLALHVVEPRDLDDLRTTRLAEPGHVATNAAQIELLVDLDQRLVGARVARALPLRQRLVVARAALLAPM